MRASWGVKRAEESLWAASGVSGKGGVEYNWDMSEAGEKIEGGQEELKKIEVRVDRDLVRVFYGQRGEAKINMAMQAAFWESKGKEFSFEKWSEKLAQAREAVVEGKTVVLRGPSRTGKTEIIKALGADPEIEAVFWDWQMLGFACPEKTGGDISILVDTVFPYYLVSEFEGNVETVEEFIDWLPKLKAETEEKGKKLVFAFDEAQVLEMRQMVQSAKIHQRMIEALRKNGIGVVDSLVEGLVENGEKMRELPKTFKELHQDSVEIDMRQVVKED